MGYYWLSYFMFTAFSIGKIWEGTPNRPEYFDPMPDSIGTYTKAFS